MKTKEYLIAFHANCIRLYEEAEIGRQLTMMGYGFDRLLRRQKGYLKKMSDPLVTDEEWMRLCNLFIDDAEKALGCAEKAIAEIEKDDQGFIHMKDEHLHQLQALVKEVV